MDRAMKDSPQQEASLVARELSTLDRLKFRAEDDYVKPIEEPHHPWQT